MEHRSPSRKRLHMISLGSDYSSSDCASTLGWSDAEVASKLQRMRRENDEPQLDRPAPATPTCEAARYAAMMLGLYTEPIETLLQSSGARARIWASHPATRARMGGARAGFCGWTPIELGAALELGAERPVAFGSWQRGSNRGLGSSSKGEISAAMLLMTAGF